MSGVSQAIRNKRQGKAVQKRVVESLGGINIGTLGGEDGSHSLFSIEVKHRQKFVGESYMVQTEKNCPEGKIPLLIVHSKNKRAEEDLVIMRMKEFKKLREKYGI